MPQERDWYKIWFEVLSNYQKYESEFKPVMAGFEFERLTSQIRFQNTTFSYSDLTEEAKWTAWVGSAADSLAFPLQLNDGMMYELVYTGFFNGMSYMVPGVYAKSMIPELGGTLPGTTYPQCDVEDKKTGYDPRCRPWFQQ